MLIKFRRYVIHRFMGRCRAEEILVLIAIAAVLAVVYISLQDIPESLDDSSFAINGKERELSVDLGGDGMEISSNRVPIEVSLSQDFVAAVLVFCATRATAIDNHLRLLTTLRPSSSAFPIVVSQDGQNALVQSTVATFISKNSNDTHIKHKITQVGSKLNYNRISSHYKWALDYVFNTMGFEYVIVTEDDLDIAPDFFSYFIWAKRVLQADPTLWCASAWNDNGLPNLIDGRKPELVWRTEFFPGLGWMLSRSLWQELSPKWPEAYWDDWMRQAETRRNRSCIRPEISRTSHNMKLAGKGSSGGLFKKFLQNIGHAKSPVDFSLLPIEGLKKESYDRQLRSMVSESLPISLTEVETMDWDRQHSYRVTYGGAREWFNLATQLGIMTDIRSGMPRTVYSGVVSTMHKGCRLYIIPKELDVDAIGRTHFTYNTTLDLQMKFIDFEKVYCRKGRFTGDCDPESDELKAYFAKKGWTKKLNAFLPMIRA